MAISMSKITNENYNTLDIKIVYCHSCYYQTTIKKTTKTNHKRLRCDLCRILIFYFYE